MYRQRLFLIPVAIAVFLFAVIARAEEKPDFWVVSTKAASGLDAENAAIILGAALEHAKQHDAGGARPSIAGVELMLGYVFAGKGEDWKRKYSLETVDLSKLDDSLKDHLAVLRKITLACDNRAKTTMKAEEKLQAAAIRYCAETVPEIEVAIRQKTAKDDEGELATAVAVKGLILSHVGLRQQSEQAYEQARRIFEEGRLKKNALEITGHLFVSRKVKSSGDEAPSGSDQPDTGMLAVTENESYIPILLIRESPRGR